MTDLPKLNPCPVCGGGETRIEPQGQIWQGQGYSAPICYRLYHRCADWTGDDFVTNQMVLRARTETQCVTAWNMAHGGKQDG